MKMVTAVLCVFLIHGLAFGQTASPGTPSTVSGTVNDAASGSPIANITIVLDASGAEFRTKTDEDGHYSLSGDFKGRCRVSSSQQHGYLSGSKAIDLAGGGMVRSGVDLRLRKGAVIAGRVLDVTKTPVSGATVHLRVEGYRDGRPALLSFWTRVTNDLGEYRVTNLYPGPYLVDVTPRPAEFHERSSANPSDDDPEPVLHDALTYYGNSLNAESASRVRVRAGEVYEQADLIMSRANGVCVSTTLVVPFQLEGREWIGVTLSEDYPMSQTRVASGRFRSGGLVEACGITPGVYLLTASTSDATGRTFFAMQSVSVSGTRAIRLPEMLLQPLQSVSGRVSVSKSTTSSSDGQAAPVIEISLQPKFRMLRAGEALKATSSTAGRFSIPATFNDEYWVKISGIPDGFYVKSVETGGKEAYSEAFHAGGGDLEVTLGVDGPNLSGSAIDKEGRPQSQATVILLAAGIGTRPSPNQFFSFVTNASGHFEFKGIPPGDYDLTALLGVPYGMAASPETLRVSGNFATRVSLPAGMRKTISVVVQEFPF